MLNLKRCLIAVTLLFMTTAVVASNFRAADLIYVPVAGRLVSGNVTFKTTVFINNVSDVPVVVDVVFAPSNQDNRNATDNFVTLDTIPAGGMLVFDDFMLEALGLQSAFGQLLFFSCAEGGDCTDCDANPADCELITVQARVYGDQPASQCYGAPDCTTAQIVAGLPWYSYVSPDVADVNLDKVIISGITVTGTRVIGNPAASSGFRSNLGFANASQFSSIQLRITLFRADATQFGSPNTNITLGPLTHTQGSVADLFPGFTGRGYVIVEVINVTPTDPNNPDDVIASGLPGFYAYGTIVDNVTDDPGTLEAMYLVEFDFLAVYGSKRATIDAMPRRPVKRP